MKTCTKCLKEKSESDFHRSKNMPDGRVYYCKECACALTRAWGANYPDKRKAAAANYYRNNRERVRIRAKEYGMKNRERLSAANKRYRESHKNEIKNMILRRMYGISLESYESMFRAQNGGCKICGKQNLDGKRLYVDHNHTTGTVRGLLCKKCNSGIAYFFEDEGLLNSAIEYLRNAPKETV